MRELKNDIASRENYLLPPGFESEGYDTKLHKAVNELISEGRIKQVGFENGYCVWSGTGRRKFLE